ncbi:hypothetical protein ACSBR2_042141 [Camellia fascicularis]
MYRNVSETHLIWTAEINLQYISTALNYLFPAQTLLFLNLLTYLRLSLSLSAFTHVSSFLLRQNPLDHRHRNHVSSPSQDPLCFSFFNRSLDHRHHDSLFLIPLYHFSSLLLAKDLAETLFASLLQMLGKEFNGITAVKTLEFLHRAVDLTLVPSAALAKELEAARVTAGNKIRLWNKGVDCESFHPKYRAQEMRIRLSNGKPERPLIVHVGRLRVEKSFDLLKSVMDQIPEARIAFIGDGPYREDLEKLFSGMPAVFTGMLGGVASLLGKRSMSFSAIEVCDHETNGVEDDLSDDGSQAGEKKRRLNLEQVKTLEKNFERARWKTKQLETDYDVLKRQFDAIKADNDALQSQNQKLQAEIIALKNREPTESINLNKETEGSSCNRSENSSEIKLDISTRTPPAMDSPSSNHHHGHPIIPTSSSRPLFPPSIITRPTSAAVAHLFPNSSSSSRQPDHKIIDHQNAVKEESFSNMFCAIDDQSGFWPWLEQQHFN